MAWPLELNSVPLLEFKLREPTAEDAELSLRNGPDPINRALVQQVERSDTCYFKTVLLSVCYFPYKDHHLAHIVFRSCFVYVGDNRMKRAVIRMAFSTAGEDTSRFPQVRSVSPTTHLSPPTPQTANDSDEVRVTLGTRTVSFNAGARKHTSVDRVHNVTIQGSVRPRDHRRDPKNMNRAVWIIEEDKVRKAGIPNLFHGSLVVSRNSPFQMHLEVAVTQGFSEAVGDLVREAFQKRDDPVRFDPSRPVDPLGLASQDMGQNLDNLLRMSVNRFVNLSDPEAK